MTTTPPITYVDAYLDFVPNLLNLSPEERAKLEETLRTQFHQALPGILERWAKLPPIIVSVGPHAPLLLEARSLYTHRYFYSCVAQCGITSERILKDIAAKHLRVDAAGQTGELPPAALEHLDFFEQARLARFLEAAKLISEPVRKAVMKLGELRNIYAHGSGKSPEEDALKALGFLHTIVEGTVSLAGQLAVPPPATPEVQ